MLTSINFFISEEFEDEELRNLVGKFCDLIDEEGLASTGDPADGIKSVGVVKLYETNGVDDPQVLEDIFEDSLFAVMPIQSKGEEDVS